MYGRARFLVLAVTLMMLPSSTHAQVSMQPTPRPAVTAENEGWYLAGEPITFAGNFYYPTGAQIFFDGNEMVRSGFYLGIPLYTRTTEEPYSRVFVPLAGALMQPYERRRAGEIAGTVGSTSPGFPVALTASEAVAGGVTGLAQAPAPPMEAPYANQPATAPRANVILPTPRTPTAGSVGTRGTVVEAQRTVRRGSRSAARPKGLNGMFIEFDHARWFNSGPATPFDPVRFTRIGDYRGFNVYRERSAPNGTIYVQIAENVTSYVTPYSRRR